MLYGRCDLESLVPYQPFVGALQHYIAQRETLDAPARARAGAGRARALHPRAAPPRPERASRPARRDRETRRYRLFEAVTRLLAYAAREAPVVLVLDDLHWADTSTALLLAHLLGDLEPACQLVLGTIRDADAHRSAELTDLLARLAPRAGVRADRAARAQTAARRSALAEAVGARVSDSFVLRLRESTEGNPFFIKETLRSVGRGLRRRRPGGRQGADRHAAGAARRDRQPAAERGLGDRARVRPRGARGAGRRARGARHRRARGGRPTRR